MMNEQRKPRVINRHREGIPLGAVYIGRPTKWENPFPIGPGCTREQSLERFRDHVRCNPHLIEQAKLELAGRDLVCFCKPKACHGDIWFEVLAGEFD